MPDIGATITLKGEQQYRKALSDIAQGQKVMRSELELVTARFDGQEKSVQGLTAKHDVLERTLNGERERINTLRAALEKSAATYGEADKRTQSWQIQLNKAEANAAKLEHQIDGTDRELEELNQSMGETGRTGQGLGDILGNLAGKLGIELPEGLRNSANKMLTLDGSTMAVIGTVGALVTALVKVEGKLMDTTKAAAAAADELMTLSQTSGIDTERLQEYQYAAELLDVSVETITGSQTKLLQSMDKASEGAAAQAEAFGQLGVAWQNADGSLRSTDEVFWDVIGALGEMENASERDALAMELVGKSARDLNPLINAGRDSMEALAKEAHDVGAVLSKEQVEALGRVDDATQRYNASVEALKNQIAVEFAPYLEDSTKKLTEFVSGLGKDIKNSGIVDAFGMLLETVTNLIPQNKELVGTISPIEAALRPVAYLVAAIADTLQFISSVVRLDFKSAGAAMGIGGSYSNPVNNQQRLQTQWQQNDYNRAAEANGYGQYYANGKWYSDYDNYLYDQWDSIQGDKGSFEYWKQLNGYNAGGSENWRGGFTWVGENGPEPVWLPRGSRIGTAQEGRMEGGITWTGNVVIDAKELSDVTRVAELFRQLPMMIRKRG